MQDDQGDVHEHRGDDRLQNADGDGFRTGGLQLAQAELVADGEGNEAQRGLGDDLQTLHLFGGVKAGNPQRADEEGAQQQTRHQIGGDGRQLDQLGHTGEHQSAHQRDGKRNQGNFHDNYLDSIQKSLLLKRAYHSTVDYRWQGAFPPKFWEMGRILCAFRRLFRWGFEQVSQSATSEFFASEACFLLL